MLPDIVRRGRWLALSCMLAIGLLSSIAHASKHVTADLTETANGLVLRVRGVDPATVEWRDVPVSKNRTRMFISEYGGATQRLYGGEKHRLNYVEIEPNSGARRKDLAITFQQYARNNGPIEEFIHRQIVEGGFDIHIYDETIPATPPAKPAQATSVTVLEKALGNGSAPAKPTAPKAVEPDDEIVIEPEAHEVDDAPAAAPLREEPDIFAGTVEPDADADTAAPKRSVRNLVPILSALALIACAAFVVVRKRWSPRLRSETDVDVISRVPIGPRQQLVHIRTAGRELLLGVTEHQVSLITQLGGSADDAPPPQQDGFFSQAPASTTAPAPPKENPSQARIDAFKRRLREALGAEVRGRDPEPEADDSAEDEIPAHLAMLQQRDPQWTRRDDVA